MDLIVEKEEEEEKEEDDTVEIKGGIQNFKN